MNKVGKIIIVVVLVISIGVVIALRQKTSSPTASAGGNNATCIQAARTEDTQPSKTLPRLVDLGARKCIPCKMMAPILEELKTEYAGRLQVDFFDVWKDPEIAKEYRVQIIPTQIFFDASGKELFRHEGFMAKGDILAKWKELGIDIKKGQKDEKTD